MAAICFGFFAVTIRMQMENQLHKIDLFHANFNYFIVLRKKTNLCSQFTHVSCTFALEIKKYKTEKSYNIFPTFPFSDIDIIRMWTKYKENEIKILVIWN